MFDRYNIGFTRGEIPVPAPITTRAAFAEAEAILTNSLKTAYLRVMWQLSQLSARNGRPFTLESVSAALADIRDMGHTPAVLAALIAGESLVSTLGSADPGLRTCDLLAISIARTDSIKACARRPA